MGGIVARHYLELLDGWRDCKAFITFGTPFLGSPQALEYLANGYKGHCPALTELMRTFTSIYQMLPAYRMVDVEGESRYVHDAGDIINVSARRAYEAYTVLDALREAAANRPSERAYPLISVVGICQRTLQSALISGGKLKSCCKPPPGVDSQHADGDGAVPLFSALAHECSRGFREFRLPEKHTSLSNHSETLQYVCEYLHQSQMRGLKNLRGPGTLPTKNNGRAWFCLDLEDAYVPGESLDLRVEMRGATSDFGELQGTIEAVVSPGVSQQVLWVREESGWVASPRLDPGLYRLSVRTTSRGPGSPPPVHDLFEVAAADITG
jgi:hypothetical protein